MKNNPIANYFVGSWSELKRVSWPTKKEILNHTIIVLVSVTTALLIASAIDYSLAILIQYIVNSKS